MKATRNLDLTPWPADDPRLVEKRATQRLAKKLCMTGRWFRKPGLREAATRRTLYKRAVRNLPAELRPGLVADGSVEELVRLVRTAELVNLTMTSAELVARVVEPLSQLVDADALDDAADRWLTRVLVNSLASPTPEAAVASLALAAEGYGSSALSTIGARLAELAADAASQCDGLDAVMWRRRALRWAEAGAATEEEVLEHRYALATMLFGVVRRDDVDALRTEAVDQLVRIEEAARMLDVPRTRAAAMKHRAVLLAGMDDSTTRSPCSTTGVVCTAASATSRCW